MVGENLQSHLVLLLRPPDLVIQLGVMESQAAVHGKRLEGLLVLLTEDDNNINLWSEGGWNLPE